MHLVQHFSKAWMLLLKNCWSCSFSQPFPVQITFSPSKLPLCMWWSGPSFNTCFLGPTWVHILNGISISSAVFAGLMIATDQPTDSQTDTPCYSVCNDKPHLHSSEMQPNNKLCNTVVKDGISQSHSINEIYNVYLYRALNFLNAPCRWFCYFLESRSRLKNFPHCRK